ncbi:MAG TPA: hypothetical protein VK155_14215 [Bacteroidales bacterium]|jgi:epoxyqueuosine reductase QueG|nr:hypothetical protein [Bacteroidales bacterium]
MIEDIIKKHLSPPSEYIHGFADLSGLLHEKYKNYSYGITIGKRLDDTIVDALMNGPTIEYLRHYKQANKELREISLRIHDDLLAKGIDSLPVTPTVTKEMEGYEDYMENVYYDISHKMVATRAGLGWIGKTDLFISEKFGPRLRLVSILLAENPGCSAEPVESGKCGKCNICVVKCPASAANGLTWNTGVHRDQFFNALKCRQKCGELANKLLNSGERICGLCVSICPIGRRTA